jgi:hypothetical protein
MIEDEIAGNWSRSDLHGVKLQRCLLERPTLESFDNPTHRPDLSESAENPRKVALWLVLEENPVGKDGYSIVYDQDRKLFGLAYRGTFIGLYGCFLDTLAAM